MAKSTTPKHGFVRRTLIRIFRVSLVLLLVFTAALAGVYNWFDKNILSTLPEDLSAYRTYRPPTACRVFDHDGALADQFYVERRIWVPLEELDAWTWHAFIAAEDRRFLEHPGVDFQGIVRAMYVNYTAGHDIQGASTITQQLVKNLMVGKEHSYERKMKEAVLAWRLEKELSKMDILELYVNYVALGSGNYGVEAASQDYFGLSARDIDPGQAALLAGLVPAPSRYSPRNEPELAAQRRKMVLSEMVEMHYLEPEDAAQFLDSPVLQPRQTTTDKRIGTAYVSQVRREVRRLLGEDIPFAKGLQVFTPLDQRVQKVAEDAVAHALDALEKRQGKRGSVGRISQDGWEAFLNRAPGIARSATTNELVFPSSGTCFETLVGPEADLDFLRAGPWRFSLTPDERMVLVRDPSPEGHPRLLAQSLGPGDVLRVCATEETSVEAESAVVHLDPRPWGEGAAVVLENATGRILALVGGFDVGLEGFIRATQAHRQPGSSFKPYVYATALLHGHTQVDTVVDAPISLPGGNGRMWSPKNYSGGYAGALPMRRALARSLNTVSVRLILETGVPDVVRTARAMGVQSTLRQDPTIALGSSEITPMDQALGYATIARLGVAAEPVFIDFVRDVDDRLLASAGEPVLIDGKAVAALPGGPGKQVLPPGVAYELLDMMREVVNSGTARRAFKPKFDRGGKTGTTNDFVDAWFVGFTPEYTVAVWIGTDGTSSLGDSETGGRSALPAWLEIMETLPQQEGERFPIPDSAILVPWEGLWIGLPRGQVPEKLLPRERLGPEPLPDFPGAQAPS